MCIRDRLTGARGQLGATQIRADSGGVRELLRVLKAGLCVGCLLYTSDAADERSSVDLGGRRIIKKKKHMRSLSIHKTVITTAHRL